MTAAELIEMLEELEPETEIRLMSQPSWPFEWSLADRLYQPDAPTGCDECGSDMVGRGHDEGCEAEGDAESFHPAMVGPDDRVAYLLEGSQLGYGTKQAFE